MKVKLSVSRANRFEGAVRPHCMVYGEIGYVNPDAAISSYVDLGLIRLKRTDGSREFYELTELGRTANIIEV